MDLLVKAKAGDADALRELIDEMVPVIANQALVVQRGWNHYYELDDVIWTIAAYIPSMLEDLTVEQAGEKWKPILAAWCKNRVYNLLRSINSRQKSIMANKVAIEDVVEPAVEVRQKNDYTGLRKLYFDFIRDRNLPQKHAEIFMATYPIQGVEETTCSSVADTWGISRQRASYIAQKLTEDWKQYYLEAEDVLV